MISQTKKRAINPMLLNVIVVSVVLHVVAGFIAGVVTIATHVIKEQATFEEPPAVQEEAPPPDVKVEIKPRKTPPVQPLQNLRLKNVGNISVANVAVNLPTMSDNFTVSAGLGGSMRGSLLSGARGSIGFGVSDIKVFGLEAKAERVLILVDASKNMLTDKKGGLNSYQVIKDEVATMIGGLNAGTLFNVALYDSTQRGGRISFFRPTLQAAGKDSHQQFISWIGGINNSVDRIGLSGHPSVPIGGSLKEDSHDEEVFIALRSSGGVPSITQLAMEQKVDAVFVVSGKHAGFTRFNYRAPLTDRQKAEIERITNDPKYQKIKAEYDAESKELEKRVAEAERKMNEQRAKKGQPPKVWGSGEESLNFKISYFKMKRTKPQPPRLPRGGGSFEADQLRRYFHGLKEVLYGVRGASGPSINVVLFLAGDEKFPEQEEASLKDYARFFKGKYRVIRGLDEIRAASAAAGNG